MSDIYYTIAGEGEGMVREKMSRFLAFAIPVDSAEEARARIKEYQNKYHDARHVCWAYMIGPARAEWQLNDNGEPSGTAGKPILGQINSLNVTDLTVIVVRYFGGIKLGTSGLTAAYREAARLAILDAGIKEMREMREMAFTFPYMSADRVMRTIKSTCAEVISQTFDNSCEMHIRYPLDLEDEIRGRLMAVDGLTPI